MAGRGTIYNVNLTTPEKLARVNPENIRLMEDFCNFLVSKKSSKGTISEYRSNLKIFFCWMLEHLGNKSFIDIRKRDIASFQSWAISDLGWSPNRLRSVKAAISSLGNYIENILDDEFENFRNITNKVEAPPKKPVREKTVWKASEVKHLLDTLVADKEYKKACFVALAAYSGRRKSELLRFEVSFFDDECLVCDGALYKTPPILTKGRSGGKMLECYTLAKEFKPYFDMWMVDRAEKGIESKWLFPDGTNPALPMGKSVVDGWNEQFSKITGKSFYPHSLRHFFTSQLSEAGIPDGVIQDIVGWESADMTRVYIDTPADNKIGKYFKNGQICVPKSISFDDVISGAEE